MVMRPIFLACTLFPAAASAAGWWCDPSCVADSSRPMAATPGTRFILTTDCGPNQEFVATLSSAHDEPVWNPTLVSSIPDSGVTTLVFEVPTEVEPGVFDLTVEAMGVAYGVGYSTIEIMEQVSPPRIIAPTIDSISMERRRGRGTNQDCPEDPYDIDRFRIIWDLPQVPTSGWLLHLEDRKHSELSIWQPLAVARDGWSTFRTSSDTVPHGTLDAVCLTLTITDPLGDQDLQHDYPCEELPKECGCSHERSHGGALALMLLLVAARRARSA